MPSNQKQLLYIFLAFAAGFAVGSNWPEIKKKVEPFLNAGSQKFGDLYAYLMQLMSEQKENFDDRMAEKKSKKESSKKNTSQTEFVASIAQMFAGANKEKLSENLAKIMKDVNSAETKKKKTARRKSTPQVKKVMKESAVQQTA
jgi:Na+-transporting methylmalonyl-CoA/oxaloacetate decarboxylase gamma subunit